MYSLERWTRIFFVCLCLWLGSPFSMQPQGAADSNEVAHMHRVPQPLREALQRHLPQAAPAAITSSALQNRYTPHEHSLSGVNLASGIP